VARSGIKNRSYQGIRIVVQVVIAAYVLLISIGQSLAWTWTGNIHTLCPFGGVANLYTYFSTGNYVSKLHSAVFVMLIALVIGLLLTGKSFCGWICPLGTVEELLGKLGRRLWPRIYDKVPRSVERVLQLLKYVLLVWILVQTARTGKLFFEPYDPYYNLFNIWTDTIAWTGYLVVGLTVVASLFIERPFCRYACPLGGLNGFFNSFSLLQIKRDSSTCIDCGRCDKACPVHVRVSQHSAVRNVECMRCLKCVEACPVNAKTNATLKLRTVFEKAPLIRRPVSSPVFMSIAILAFAIPIILAMTTGNFLITVKHVYNSPADIKGSSPLQDVITNFDISQQALYNAFGIPEGVAPSTLLKSVQPAMGLPEKAEIVSPESIRTVITYMNDTLATFVEKAGADATRVAEVAAKAGLTDSSTLRQLMEKGEPGAVAYALVGQWAKDLMTPSGGTTSTSGSTGATTTTGAPAGSSTTKGTGGGQGSSTTGTGGTDTSTTAPDIKGTNTLGDMKVKVKDFDAFLLFFKIPATEPMTITLKDLGAKYGFEVTAIRDYVASGK
jgi:polyferredoxin